MINVKKAMQLYAVTDNFWSDKQSFGKMTLTEQVEEALKGGVSCVQLREKELDEKEFLKRALEIKKQCAFYNVPFIINDNVEIAIKSEADGIHVGQGDMEARKIRELIGKDKILGVSVQTIEQAVAAQAAGADYLGVGAVFPTTTKLDASDVSMELLKSICDAVSIPVVAIGGISKKNIMELSGSGIDGVALVSAIFGAKSIALECQELYLLTAKMLQTVEDFLGKVEGVIFDLDGTLLDSMWIWDRIGNDYLDSIGIKAQKDLSETLKEMSMKQAAQYFQTEYGVKKSEEQIIAEVNELIADFYNEKVQLKEGVAEFLSYLSDKKIKMCVATASDRTLAINAMKRLNIVSFFEEVYTCGEIGCGKESAAIFEMALKKLETRKENTLVVEDSLHAIKTAKKAGFKVLGIYDSAEINQEKVQMYADYYWKSFEMYEKLEEEL